MKKLELVMSVISMEVRFSEKKHADCGKVSK